MGRQGSYGLGGIAAVPLAFGNLLLRLRPAIGCQGCAHIHSLAKGATFIPADIPFIPWCGFNELPFSGRLFCRHGEGWLMLGWAGRAL